MTRDNLTSPLIAVVGPTASGKSDLGITLAERFNGEIINCDSVQVYRGIYIATAKVPPSEQRGIPHHLIDIVEPTVNFTAVDWAERARKTINEIESRGHRAMLIGGTGFYLRALAMTFCDSPEIDESLRPRLQRLIDRHGPEHLHRLLARVDPVLAEKYAPRDWSRVTRALEVYFSSGRSLLAWQQETPADLTSEGMRMHYLVLNPPREALYERINTRADLMVAQGLIEEVRDLIDADVPPTAKAFGAHGYRRVVEYLLGRRTLDDAIEQMKLDTRHYAKRQWTWWRRQSNTHWLDGFGFEPATIDEASQIVSGLMSPVA